MKCNNCGGNYAARELRCPYCGTENATGKRWKQQREKAQQDYRTAETETFPVIRKKMANKVLNRVLLAEGGLFLLWLLGIFVVFLLSDFAGNISFNVNKNKFESHMSQLYEAEEYGELYSYMSDKNLIGQNYYEYSQMSLIYFDYSQFTEMRLQFFTQIQSDSLERHTVDRLLAEIRSVLDPHIPAYPDVTAENWEKLKPLQEDVLGFAYGMLGLTEEEIARMTEDIYLDHDIQEALIDTVMERRVRDES